MTPGVLPRYDWTWRLVVALLFLLVGGAIQSSESFVFHSNIRPGRRRRRQGSIYWPGCVSLEDSSFRNSHRMAPGDENVTDNEAAVGPLLEHIQASSPGISEAIRIFHGRGGLFSGCEHITLDWFPPVWLLTSYNHELDSKVLGIIQGAIQRRHDADAITAPLSNGRMNLVYQFRSMTNATTIMLKGSIPQPHVVTENGMKFLVRLDRAKNHGIFLDMANGRQWIREQAKGKTVLNLFSYTCGFSVAALCGGAESVVNMDMVDGVVKTGQRNHELNGLKEGARFLAHDIFKSWGKIRKLGPYDIIVADPPTFQKRSFVAKKDYGKLVRRLADLLAEGGMAMLCLNAPELDIKWLQEVVALEAPSLEFVERLANPSSFPSADPDRGLKVLLYRLVEPEN